MTEKRRGLVIGADERAVFIGKTNSGKTYLARALASGIERLIVMDPKGRLTDKTKWNLTTWEKGYPKLLKGEAARVRVPAPGIDDADPNAYWHQHFKLIFQLENVIVYIDELYGVGPEKGSPGLRALYTQGRELGIGVWSCVQRPTQIPIFAVSEAEWVFLFQLKWETDRERMASLIGPEADHPLKGHSFMAYHETWVAPVLYKPVKVVKGVATATVQTAK